MAALDQGHEVATRGIAQDVADDLRGTRGRLPIPGYYNTPVEIAEEANFAASTGRWLFFAIADVG